MKYISFFRKNRDFVINYFFAIACKDGLSLEKTWTLIRDDKVFQSWLVPLANDEGWNLFAYSLKHGEEGTIYYYSHEFSYGDEPKKYVVFLAKDIDIFLDSLDAEE